MYECTRCGYASERKSNVARHFRRIHCELKKHKICVCGELEPPEDWTAALRPLRLCFCLFFFLTDASRSSLETHGSFASRVFERRVASLRVYFFIFERSFRFFFVFFFLVESEYPAR